MRFRAGTVRQKALFGILLGVYALGALMAVDDKLARIGRPDIGWVLDGFHVFPLRSDAAAAGLHSGGHALRVNGMDVAINWREIRVGARRQIGESNTVTLESSAGAITEVTIPVRPLEWRDVLFAEGPNIGLGVLFVVVGVASFLLRPYAASSWALLALCSALGSFLISRFVDVGPSGSLVGPSDSLRVVYFRLMVAFLSCVPVHAGLAFPVIHPLLLRRPRVLWLVYGLGAGLAGMQLLGWSRDWAGPLRYFGGGLDTSVLLVGVVFFLGRCVWLAVDARDPLVAQRARILLAGVSFGVLPALVLNFIHDNFRILVIDLRLAYWSLTLFLLALGYLTLRHDLLNARIAVRRAVIYAVVVGVLTVLAVLLIALQPFAVAALLLPLLYWWPRFDARLNSWFYPKRARFPELVRAIGGELAASQSAGAVLAALAHAPERLCDARNAAAFLLAGEDVSTVGCTLADTGRRLSDEVLVQLMRTTRREILRDHIAVEPQYANIKDDCYACFDRLHADVLVPLLRDNTVVGGLAIGPRATADMYEAPELAALATVAQQAVQAIGRVEATERLRDREVEFADLKRFFPPQIIDQVMAKGGAAELRSQRKLVTVLFADLRGFTSFSDSVEPEEVMATLAEYHNAMGRRIAEFAGTLERFAGDGFMVFFNDPVDQPDHVERAVRMALAMRADVQQLRATWLHKGYQIDVGIGLHTGYATCGFVGYEGRRDYAVIGNVTNLAARLSAAAAGSEILITARVRSELHDGYRTEPAGELALKGFHQPQAAYRLLDADARQRAAG